MTVNKMGFIKLTKAGTHNKVMILKDEVFKLEEDTVMVNGSNKKCVRVNYNNKGEEHWVKVTEELDDIYKLINSDFLELAQLKEAERAKERHNADVWTRPHMMHNPGGF